MITLAGQMGGIKQTSSGLQLSTLLEFKGEALAIWTELSTVEQGDCGKALDTP